MNTNKFTKKAVHYYLTRVDLILAITVLVILLTALIVTENPSKIVQLAIIIGVVLPVFMARFLLSNPATVLYLEKSDTTFYFVPVKDILGRCDLLFFQGKGLNNPIYLSPWYQIQDEITKASDSNYLIDNHGMVWRWDYKTAALVVLPGQEDLPTMKELLELGVVDEGDRELVQEVLNEVVDTGMDNNIPKAVVTLFKNKYEKDIYLSPFNQISNWQ